MITNDVKQQVLELRAQNYSFAKIADRLKIGKQTAVDIVGENRFKVEALQAIEEEQFLEANKANRRGRLEQLSILAQRIRQELAARDLTEVPTEKLAAMFLKTMEAIKAEVGSQEPKPRSTKAQEIEQEKQDNPLSIWNAL